MNDSPFDIMQDLKEYNPHKRPTQCSINATDKAYLKDKLHSSLDADHIPQTVTDV